MIVYSVNTPKLIKYSDEKEGIISVKMELYIRKPNIREERCGGF